MKLNEFIAKSNVSLEVVDYKDGDYGLTLICNGKQMYFEVEFYPHYPTLSDAVLMLKHDIDMSYAYGNEEEYNKVIHKSFWDQMELLSREYDTVCNNCSEAFKFFGEDLFQNLMLLEVD